MGELCDLLSQEGFRVREAGYFPGEATDFIARSIARRAAAFVKWPFYLVPHLRGSLLVVAEA